MYKGLLFYKKNIDGPWQPVQSEVGDNPRDWATRHYHSGEIAGTSPVFFWTGKSWYYAPWDAYNNVLVRGSHIPAEDVPGEIKLQALVLGISNG